MSKLIRFSKFKGKGFLGSFDKSWFVYIGTPTRFVFAIHHRRSGIHTEVFFEFSRYFKRDDE